MEEIIAPISKEILKQELTEDKRLRRTNKSNNEIYIVTAHNAPNVMKEIGRLREIAFRAGGGGTGLSMDIDEYDTMENPYRQLIVWNPESEEIIGILFFERKSAMSAPSELLLTKIAISLKLNPLSLSMLISLSIDSLTAFLYNVFGLS